MIIAPDGIPQQIEQLNRWLANDSATGQLGWDAEAQLWCGEIKWLSAASFAIEFAKQSWQYPRQTQLFIKGVISAVHGFDEMDDRFVEVARGYTILNFQLRDSKGL